MADNSWQLNPAWPMSLSQRRLYAGVIEIDWQTKVITIPQNYLTLVDGALWELDVYQLHLDLKDQEDSEIGMVFPDTHEFTTSKTLSGATFAPFVEIINGYTIVFEDTGQPYTVRCEGANHNIRDVMVPGSTRANLLVNNSAGLIVVEVTPPSQII